jgi:hypothetical protein
MGDLIQYYSKLAERCGNLRPLQEPIRQRLFEGNQRLILGGQDIGGGSTAPLSPRTIATRQGDGPPRAPRYNQSRSISLYKVTVDAYTGHLRCTASWPGFNMQMSRLDAGDPATNLPARPIRGFQEVDKAWIRRRLQRYVVKGEV